MAEMYLESRVAEEEGLKRVSEIGAPSWYRQGMSDAEYDRHITATLVGRRDMYLDISDDGVRRVLERLPDGF